MGVAAIWEKWKVRRALANELSSLDTIQREELARDSCVSEDIFEHLYVAGDRTDELERLMCALSLDIEQSEIANPGAVTRDMSLVCSRCLMINRCRRELEAGSAKQNYNDYCPNALTLNALLEAQTLSRLPALT
ncbi:MAG: hypothetical protein J0H75_16490, partial [Rhizobiales bacterium]|nr:hypothetical protein [Hyphomicrobiales bacterium]